MKIPFAKFNGKVIGLAGPAGCGKDTIAQILGWPRAAFADRLKADLERTLDWLGINLDIRQDKEKARGLLVEYGKLGRSIRAGAWIDRLEVEDGAFCLISDVRYPNEAKAIDAKGGAVFYIHRVGVEAANEEEARSLLSMVVNCRPKIIDNISPKDAANQIINYCGEIWGEEAS